MDAKQVLRWRHWLQEMGLGESQASIQIGRDRSYLRKLFSRAEENKSVDPGVAAVDALGRILGRSHEEMMGRALQVEVTPDSEQPTFIETQAAKVAGKMMRVAEDNARILGGRLSAQDILAWWGQTKGVIDPHADELESCDLVAPPAEHDQIIQPKRIGSKSLANNVLSGEGVADMMRLLRTTPESQRVEMVQSYRYAASSKVPVINGPHSMTITNPGMQPYVVEFIRIQLPVSTPDGSQFILNYSFPL